MDANRNATLLVTAIAPAIWGTTFLVTTLCLPPGAPLTVGAVRALAAGLLLALITRRAPQGIWWWRALLLGGLNIGAFFAMLFIAADRLPGGVAATILATQPVMVAGLSALLLGERVSMRTVLAGAAGVVGVGLLVLQAELRIDLAGVMAALGGAVVMATGVVASKRWSSPEPAAVMASWQLVGGGLLLLPVAILVEGMPSSWPSAAGVAGFAYLAVIGAALAYTLWFRGIAALSPITVSFLGLLSPVVAAGLGWVVLDEQLNLVQLSGVLLVLAAVAIAQAPLPITLARMTPVGRRAHASGVAWPRRG